MQEAKKDLFDCIFEPEVDAICITTNGHWTTSGDAMMGGGCAGICARRWPKTASNLGFKLKTFMANVPFVIGALDEDGEYLEPTLDLIKNKKFKCLIISFPTIDNLMDGSKIELIKKSTTALVSLADRLDLKGIMLPRPGVGIGGLSWKNVKPEIENSLNDRFTIVSFEHEE